MAFSDFPFPPSTPLFPRASIVQTYLESYCSHFKLAPHIRLNTTIEDVQRCLSDWRVQTSAGEVFHFDFVIVANGHHRIPRYPDIPGLSKWLTEGRAMHSAWYRYPRYFGKSVLVVGAGPSGQDISAELRTVADSVIHSIPGTLPVNIGNLKRRNRVVKFKHDREVCFEDGTVESEVDYCILATGYETAFPFFRSPTIQKGFPPPSPPLPCDIFDSSYHVFPLAMHIFPLQANFPPSSLAFMGLLVRAVQFPLLEAQAHAIATVFSHHDSLDTTQEAINILDRYEILRNQYGDLMSIGKNWHHFHGHEQFDYRDHLYEFAERNADRRVVVAQWEKDMYDKKDVLRSVWNNSVHTGEADQWVNKVGEGGQEEWVELMRKMCELELAR